MHKACWQLFFKLEYMIIGEDFVWIHFPKCAGTFTEQLLRKYYGADPRMAFDPIAPGKNNWHDSVLKREKSAGIDLSRKQVICNIRRLPYWIISRVKYEEARSGHRATREMYTGGMVFEQDGTPYKANRLVNFYTIRKVDHWIRVEYLAEDFYRCFGRYLDVVSRINESEFATKINSTAGDARLDTWFGEGDLERLYASNSIWTKLEMELYGNLLTTSP